MTALETNILAHYHKYSVKEIAERLNVSIIEVVRVLRDNYIITASMADAIIKDTLLLAAAKYIYYHVVVEDA